MTSLFGAREKLVRWLKQHERTHRMIWFLRHPIAFMKLFKTINMSEQRLHINVQAYWRNSTGTFLAGDGYYERAEIALKRDVLPLLQPNDSVLDVGCGNGRYTLLLAEHVATVKACDLSPQLIQQARDAARIAGITNVSFDVQDVQDVQDVNMQMTFNMVVCMGVLVCLIEDKKFNETLSFLAERVCPGGYLVLRETIRSRGKKIVHNPTHSGCYRSLRDYSESLEKKGFSLLSNIELVSWSVESTNHQLVYRRV